LISVYISVTANKLTSSPMHHPEIEVTAIMLYLYLVSCAFLLYLLLHLAHPPHSHANIRSHGSAFLRQGAFVFGVGSIAYHVLEFTSYFIIDLHPNCMDVLHTVMSFFSILFVILQMITIILYPRLNIHFGYGIPHIGLMHLLATNLIIWMRTIIKESIHEYHIAEEKLEDHDLNVVNHVTRTGIIEHKSTDDDGDLTLHNIHKRFSENVDSLKDHISVGQCQAMYHDDDFVSDVLKASSPFLYSFIIEFSLVGGTVFFNTWNNVNNDAKAKIPNHTVQKPNLCGTLSKINWSNSTIGSICGCIIMLLTIFDLIVFFSVDYEEDVVFEYIGKVMNCTINTSGILASLIGIVQIQRLSDKSQASESSVDLFLLDLGVFFVYIYSTLTVTVGIFTTDQGIPGNVHIFNGVFEIAAASLQVLLIHQLLDKTINVEESNLRGRQVVTFLCFLNFSIWLFDTFELQKSKASLVEAEFYGHLVWVWMQRITLPICIFFRFHSTVLLIDCWKNSYRGESIGHLIANINKMEI